MKAVVASMLVLCYLAVTHAWSCNEGPQLCNAAQVDVGQGTVVARDTAGYVYSLIGSEWHKMSSVAFKHSSVGPAGLWATSLSESDNSVYKYVAGSFELWKGLPMQQVDAGGNGQIVGISCNRAYCLPSTYASTLSGSGSQKWKELSNDMMYISCGPLYGCWGIDTSDQIYFTQSITPTCDAGDWSQVEGAAVMVEVGTDGSVFVVNRGGNLYQRTGISSSTPQGTGWNHIPMCMSIRHVSYDMGAMWVVTKSGLLLKCTP